MGISLDMEIKLTARTRQLLIRIGAAVLVLALAVYVLIVIPVRQGRALDARLAAAKTDLSQKRRLAPLLLDLERDAENASLAALVPSEQDPATRTDFSLMPQEITAMAQAAGVEPVEVALDPASITQDPGTIRITGVFAGRLAACRALLLRLAALPSLASIERMEVRAVAGHIEMMTQLRIALKS